MTSDVVRELNGVCSGSVKEHVSLKTWTTFHCNATARALISPKGIRDLVEAVRVLTKHQLNWGSEWSVIGRGSNLLVRDGGYPGILLDLSEGFVQIETLDENDATVVVRAEAGVPNGTLLQWTREQNLDGFGFAFGIPGTIGGGIRMNAGTPLGWFSNLTTYVEGVDLLSREVAFAVTQDDFKYRDFPLGRDLIITAGRFLFHRSSPEMITSKIEAAKLKRSNQPLEFPNVGSVFKNPEDDFAGRLIEAAGLKGMKRGDAQISEKHANFIVNLGSAKTSDVLALIQLVQTEVQKKFSIQLEPEVHVIGVEA